MLWTQQRCELNPARHWNRNGRESCRRYCCIEILCRQQYRLSAVCRFHRNPEWHRQRAGRRLPELAHLSEQVWHPIVLGFRSRSRECWRRCCYRPRREWQSSCQSWFWRSAPGIRNFRWAGVAILPRRADGRASTSSSSKENYVRHTFQQSIDSITILFFTTTTTSKKGTML